MRHVYFLISLVTACLTAYKLELNKMDPIEARLIIAGLICGVYILLELLDFLISEFYQPIRKRRNQ
ncbi:MAG: hypothetical protein WED82_02075 [Balneolales bacterium]